MKFNRYSAMILGGLVLFAMFLSPGNSAHSYVDEDQRNREEIVKHPSWINRSLLNDKVAAAHKLKTE